MAAKKAATSNFLTTVGGEEHFVHAGEVLPATHPAVKANPEAFEAEEAEPATTPKKRTTKKT